MTIETNSYSACFSSLLQKAGMQCLERMRIFSPGLNSQTDRHHPEVQYQVASKTCMTVLITPVLSSTISQPDMQVWYILCLLVYMACIVQLIPHNISTRVILALPGSTYTIQTGRQCFLTYEDFFQHHIGLNLLLHQFRPMFYKELPAYTPFFFGTQNTAPVYGAFEHMFSKTAQCFCSSSIQDGVGEYRRLIQHILLMFSASLQGTVSGTVAIPRGADHPAPCDHSTREIYYQSTNLDKRMVLAVNAMDPSTVLHPKTDAFCTLRPSAGCYLQSTS